MLMEAALLLTDITTEGTSGTASSPMFGRSANSFDYLNAPAWKEVPADPIADALTAAGSNASQISNNAKAAARAVLNLVSDLILPPLSIGVEENEITLEWYKDRHNVAVVAVDGQSISWAVMAGPANPLKGKESFAMKLPDGAFRAINAVASA